MKALVLDPMSEDRMLDKQSNGAVPDIATTIFAFAAILLESVA